jgi:uroporphyrinogen-III synthase
VQKLQSQFVAYEKTVDQLRKEVYVVTEVPAVEHMQSDLQQNVEQIRRDYELVS